MAIRTELHVRLPNSPGALVGVCRLLASEHVNLLALSLEPRGELRLIVDNPLRAASALRGAYPRVDEHQVLVVSAPHAHGGLAPMLQLVADAGVNIEYAYSAPGDAPGTATVVVGVEDAMRAGAVAGI